MSNRHSYGWTPDLPDKRDMVMAPPAVHLLPQTVDLRPNDTAPIYDQGQLGSCTANAIAAALRFTLKKNGQADIDPSRLYIYYKEREMEGAIAVDGGAQIRDGMKVVDTGFIQESEWPYDIATFASPPGPDNIANMDSNAKHDHVVIYQRVLRDFGMRACLAAGFPFVMGVTVYESFESAQGGTIPMPALSEQVLGGHAILCVGYDAVHQIYRFRNSWGSSWGQGGYGTLPFAYLNDPGLSSDFWAIFTEDIDG